MVYINTRYILLPFLLFFLTYNSIGQEISFALDSIHKLPKDDYQKLDLYYKYLNNLEIEKEYTQLGFDAHQLAKWIYKSKKITEAIKISQMACEAREKAEPYHEILLKQSYHNYGLYNFQNDNFYTTIKIFQKLLNLKESDYLHGRAYEYISDSYRYLGDNHKSIEYQKKTLTSLDSSDINQGALITANIKLALSYVQIRSKESSKLALYHLLKAQELLKQRSKPDLYLEYTIQNNIGNLYCEGVGTKDTLKCIKSYKSALQALNEINLKDNLSATHSNLAQAFIKLDSSEAEYQFSEAIKYSIHNQSMLPKIYFAKGLKELYYHKYLKAQRNFTTSLKYYFNKKQDILPTWLPTKGEMRIINDPPKFLELLKRKLRVWNALAEKENNPEFYQEAIKTAYTCDEFVNIQLEKDFSNRTKLQWRSLASQIYLMGLEACVMSQNYKDAFHFLEKSKALLLLHEIDKNEIELPLSIKERNLKFNNEIASIRSQIRSSSGLVKDSLEEVVLSAEANLKSYQDSLSTIYSQYFSKYSIPTTISLDSVDLKRNEVIIEYLMGLRVAGAEPEAYGLFLSNQKKHLFKVENVKALKNDIYEYRSLLNQPFKTKQDKERFEGLAYSIYIALFPEKIQQDIKNKKLTVIADNILNYIPFEALITDINKKTYLLEDTEVRYTYSLSFDQTNSKINRKTEEDFLGIAPVQFKDSLITLPNSKKELSFANNFYKGKLLLNEAATKQNFKELAKNYKILHFATHADASDSLNPWIAFRGDKLTELEIGVMPQQADLVMLSACSTSLGEVRQGEGVLSLARGFFKSGAKTVISTLWNTNDKATAEITKDFYKNLSKGATKSEALHKAKLNYLKNHSGAEASPHYWASLVLIGDTGQLLPANNFWLLFMVFLSVLLGLIYILYLLKRKKNFKIQIR